MSNHMAALLLAALGFAGPTAAVLRGTGAQRELSMNLLLTDMHPEVVSKLLSQVGKRWEEACVSSLRNPTDGGVALSEMSKSCSKVAKAVVDGSDGEKDRVVDYMHDVCSANKGSEEENKRCDKFSESILGFMVEDSERNRDDLDYTKFCKSYWADAVTPGAKLIAQRLDAEDAERAKAEAGRKQQEEEQRQKEKEEAEAREKAAAENATALAQSQELQAAENKTEIAKEDDAKAEAHVKNAEVSMASEEEDAMKLVDRARQELQVANEKEAATAEAKAEKAKPEATPVSSSSSNETAAVPKDEAAAKSAGDKMAEEISEKAVDKVAKALAGPQTDDVDAATKDDEAAKASGDAMAEEIAEKAEEKAEEKEMKEQEDALKAEPKKAAVSMAVQKQSTAAKASVPAKAPAKDAKKAVVSKK